MQRAWILLISLFLLNINAHHLNARESFLIESLLNSKLGFQHSTSTDLIASLISLNLLQRLKSGVHTHGPSALIEKRSQIHCTFHTCVLQTQRQVTRNISALTHEWPPQPNCSQGAAAVCCERESTLCVRRAQNQLRRKSNVTSKKAQSLRGLFAAWQMLRDKKATSSDNSTGSH